MKNLLFCLLVVGQLASAQTSSTDDNFLNLNRPERLEWLKDAGFGMFIHFSFDSQLGIVISHSMAGASPDYLDRFINDLPKTFNPKEFSANDIAVLAKLSGMKYIVLTTKHHSGFCLWDTKTTDFNIMNTPYGRDMVQDYVKACRDNGLAVGFYYSPEDFNFLHENGQTVRRRFPDPIPDDVMNKYLDFTEKQLTELLTRYGKIDVIFFDGGEGPLQEKSKEVVWRLQPDILVTRGAISTPEQHVPGLASDEAWEANATIGTQWQFKPTNDDYKSGGRLIEILIESRAKGGTFLLNIGPHPNGHLPAEQDNRLREVAAWMFVNQESIYDVRPWIITNEKDIWFTKSKDSKDLYVLLTRIPGWRRGDRKTFTLKSVKATAETTISVLGQSSELVEYMPDVDASARFEQKKEGLEISVVRAHRIYNNHKWPNPIVVKLENVEPALDPPFVQTQDAEAGKEKATLSGELVKTGNEESFEVGFLYRPYAGFAENLTGGEWKYSKFVKLNSMDKYSVEISELESGLEYEYRAVVRHPKIEIPGAIKRFTAK